MPRQEFRLNAGPIDMHAHIVPPAFLKAIETSGRPGFSLARDKEGGRRLTLGGKPMQNPIMAAMDSMEIRQKTMAEQGVAAQIVSPWIALIPNPLEEEDAGWLASLFNDCLAETVAAHPDILLGIGSVPLRFPERAARMLRRMVETQGLIGAEINTTLGPDRFLDDPALDPFWAEAEGLGALIMIHPSLGGSGKQYESYYLNNLIHNPVETAVAGAHLIFGGVLERFPALRICLVHGGGMLPYDIGRLRRGHKMRKETQVTMKGSIDDSYNRFLFDTVTHSASALRFLVQEVGAERVFLGSDYPFDMADPDPVATVRAATFPAAEEEAILSGNLGRLFGGH